MYEPTIKMKSLRYGTVEIRDAGCVSPRYRLYVNGQIKDASDDLNAILRLYDQYN